VKISNKSFKSVSEFKYLGTSLRKKEIHEEIRSINSGNACYCSV